MLLIFKATEQFKRINVDLKGPVLVNNGKKSLLVVVDVSIQLFHLSFQVVIVGKQLL